MIHALGIFGAGLLVAGAIVSLAAFTTYPQYLFGGDFVHPLLLIKDISLGGSIFEWNSSAALYAFPDWLWSAPIFLPMSPTHAVLLSSFLLFLTVTFAGGLLAKQVSTRPISLTAGVIAYTSVLIMTIWFAGHSILDWLYAYSGSVYIHTGAAAMALACGSLYLTWCWKGGIWRGVTLVILALLTTYSDPLFFIWLCAPCLVASAIFFIRFREWRVAAKGALVFAVGLIALLLEANKPFPSAGRAGLIGTRDESLARTLSFVADGLYAADPILLILAAAVLGSIILAASLTFKRHVEHGRLLTTCLLASMAGAIVLAPIALALIQDISSLRYMIGIIPLLPALLINLTPRLPWTAAALPAAAVVALAIPTTLNLPQRIHHASLDPLIDCLLDRGLTDGMAGYAHAKPLILLSDGAIHVEQVGIHAPTNFSTRLRRERLDGGRFSPDFLILASDVTEEYAIANFGQPEETVNCHESLVWVYGDEGIESPILGQR